MKVGNYQIGRYHGIIKKTYTDGSVIYETSFTDATDLAASEYAIIKNIGKLTGTATDSPKVLADVSVIRGKDNIIKELVKSDVKNK